jgi:hypothetical protein
MVQKLAAFEKPKQQQEMLTLSDIRLFSIHDISITARVIYSYYLQAGSLCCPTSQLADAVIPIIHVRNGGGK